MCIADSWRDADTINANTAANPDSNAIGFSVTIGLAVRHDYYYVLELSADHDQRHCASCSLPEQYRGGWAD
jgi:hypothetical protein